MKFLDLWTLTENYFEKYLQGIWFVFSFRRESNRDREDSRSAWHPGILSKLRRAERTCYLLEPDICCCEMISSIKKHGHQLLLIQPSSWSGLLTTLPACADQAVPGTEHSQPRAASPLLPQDLSGRPSQALQLGSWLPLIPLFGHSEGCFQDWTPCPCCFLSGKQDEALLSGLSHASRKELHTAE